MATPLNVEINDSNISSICRNLKYWYNYVLDSISFETIGFIYDIKFISDNLTNDTIGKCNNHTCLLEQKMHMHSFTSLIDALWFFR